MEVTYRTQEGRFLLRASEALNRILVGVLARAQSLFPVELIGLVVLSNHLHLLLWVENQSLLSRFMHHFGNNSTREVNKLQGRTGSLWGHRYQGICVTTEEAAQVERLAYLLSQAVKEGLVERVQDWPGIHFGKTLLEGRSLLAGIWIDRSTAYRVRRRGREPAPQDYIDELTVELKPLPCWSHLSWGEYLERIRTLVERVEREAAEAREARRREARSQQEEGPDATGPSEGGPGQDRPGPQGMEPPIPSTEVLGAKRVLGIDPRYRPARLKRRPRPRVHAASRAARKAWEEAFGWFLQAYRDAAEKLRNGDRSARFPRGCFPPGLPYVTEGAVPLPAG